MAKNRPTESSESFDWESIKSKYEGKPLTLTDRCPITKKEGKKQSKLIKNCSCPGCETWKALPEEQRAPKTPASNPKHASAPWKSGLALTVTLIAAGILSVIVAKDQETGPEGSPSKTPQTAPENPSPSNDTPAADINSRTTSTPSLSPHRNFPAPMIPPILGRNIDQPLSLTPLSLTSQNPGEYSQENLEACYQALNNEGIGYFTRRYNSPERIFIGWRHETSERASQRARRVNERSQFLLLRALIMLYQQAGVRVYRVEGRSTRNELERPNMQISLEQLTELSSNESSFINFIRREGRRFKNNVVDIVLAAFPQTGGSYCEDYEYMMRKDDMTGRHRQHQSIINNIVALINRHNGYNIGVIRNRRGKATRFCLGPGGDMPFPIRERDRVVAAVTAHIDFMEDAINKEPEERIPAALARLERNSNIPEIILYGSSHHDHFQTFFDKTDSFVLAVNHNNRAEASRRRRQIERDIVHWKKLRSRLQALLY